MKCLPHPLLDLLKFKDDLRQICQYAEGCFSCLLFDSIGVRVATFDETGIMLSVGHRDWKLSIHYPEEFLFEAVE